MRKPWGAAAVQALRAVERDAPAPIAVRAGSADMNMNCGVALMRYAVPVAVETQQRGTGVDSTAQGHSIKLGGR